MAMPRLLPGDRSAADPTRAVTLGVMGGGQLGRMFVHAAQQLGFRTVVLEPDATSPAGTVDSFTTMGPFPIPTINTCLLLLSGVTLTISHHALRAGHRAKTAFWLFATICLGATFMGFQVYEYMHAYSELNLKLTSGIYGATFFMLTGFHGFHVTLGAIMLSVILYRVLKGHFTPEHHFGFEGAAWYWHFVDVVWLGLYVVVYWL